MKKLLIVTIVTSINPESPCEADVCKSDLPDDLPAGDGLGDGGDEPDVDELTENQEFERAEEYYEG